MPCASQWRIYYHIMWGQLLTTFSNVLKQPNGELLVAVNHNQQRTMTSETVDPIDWSHPPPSWAVPPERLIHSINQCNLSGNRRCNRIMRGNHLAYAATQGMQLRDVWRLKFVGRIKNIFTKKINIIIYYYILRNIVFFFIIVM